MLSPDLLRSLRRLEDLPRLAAALGYTPVWCELPDGALPTVPGATAPRPAAIVARDNELSWYAVQGAGPAATRRMARAIAARGMVAAVFGLELEGRRLSLATLDSPPLCLSLDRPDPLDLARLGRCTAPKGSIGLAAAFRVAEALAGLGVDDRFFAAFRHHLDAVTAALPTRMPLVDRHALALLQLTRILFLYFVEAKGWLAGRPRFLREEVDRCVAARRSLHRDLLQPLFFGTLNRPFPDRSRLARGFGPIPFLNGGLFEPHPLERRARFALPTPLLLEAFDALFEKFHFTLAPGPAGSIAPDMLGRVFERVMEPGQRHATGTYYTPAPLVEALLQDGLATWLSGQSHTSWAQARRQVDDPDSATLRSLSRLRLLDPAVGSGAFLLGALRILCSTQKPGRGRAAQLRQVVAGNLFGVDRNAAAVRLAELRLWLEVVAADPSERAEAVAPLPNLDALVRQGDSLVDPAAGIPLRPPEPARAAALQALRSTAVNSTGPAKRAAVVALMAAEREIARSALGGAVGSLNGSIDELLDLARTPTLFGARRGLTPVERSRLLMLRATRRRARERLRALVQAGEVPWFHYDTHFADVFARGGFDLVVGNPPWVRAESLPPDQRRYLAERFCWFRGARANGQGYPHQPDLAVAFLERSLELLAPGGVVALLLPAKLATTGYATAARADLSRRTTIAVAADLRQDSRAGFDATVYPMALVAALHQPPGNHRVRLGLDSAEGSAQGNAADPVVASVPQSAFGPAPWPLLPDAAREALVRLAAGHPVLGQHFTCHLGVKTGLNQVFLDPPADIEEDLLRWAVRGRDVRAWRIRPGARLLWPCDERGAPLDTLPAATARYLRAHIGPLQRRTDHKGGKAWTLFRTRAATAPVRVIWPDLARRLEVAVLCGARSRRVIPLNTCYVIAARHPDIALRLTAWLNSTWCRAAAAAVADPASGGYARFNARVVSGLPWPVTLLEDKVLLSLGRRGVRHEPIQEALDDRCAELLSLTLNERDALARMVPGGAEPGC